MRRVYIGIDPGASGAIAAHVKCPGGEFIHWMKLSESDADVSTWLKGLVAGGDVFALIEKVHSMPKQGVASSFKFGESAGFLRGLLVSQEIPFEYVTPQRWQTALSCRSGGDKNVTKQAAQRLFPREKITHANADALLIAEYCRRVRGAN